MQVHYNVTLLAFHQASLASSRNYGSFRRENFTNKQDQFLSYKRKRIALYSRHSLVLNQTIRSCQTLHPKLKKKKKLFSNKFPKKLWCCLLSITGRRRVDLMVSAMGSGSRGLGSRPGHVIGLCSRVKLSTLTVCLSTVRKRNMFIASQSFI